MQLVLNVLTFFLLQELRKNVDLLGVSPNLKLIGLEFCLLWEEDCDTIVLQNPINLVRKYKYTFNEEYAFYKQPSTQPNFLIRDRSNFNYCTKDFYAFYSHKVEKTIRTCRFLLKF